MLHRRGDRVLVGHDGAMPGFLAGLAVRRPDKVGAVVLANTSAGADPGGLAVDLALRVLDEDPAPADVWRPGPPVPAAVEELLGQWWTEGVAYAFSAKDGRLEIKAVTAPVSAEPSVLTQEGPDVFRVASGRAQGELLRVVRRDDGTIKKLYWVTYPVTRDPRPFGA
jgi:pimeloyl-ACP methyl ester carboxylesterase